MSTTMVMKSHCLLLIIKIFGTQQSNCPNCCTRFSELRKIENFLHSLKVVKVCPVLCRTASVCNNESHNVQKTLYVVPYRVDQCRHLRRKHIKNNASNNGSSQASKDRTQDKSPTELGCDHFQLFRSRQWHDIFSFRFLFSPYSSYSNNVVTFLTSSWENIYYESERRRRVNAGDGAGVVVDGLQSHVLPLYVTHCGLPVPLVYVTLWRKAYLTIVLVGIFIILSEVFNGVGSD